MLSWASRPLLAAWITLLVSVFGLCLGAGAQETNQFHLAAQFDWGASRGFFFVVEGTPDVGKPATVASAKLTLGVGDGHGWHFASGKTDWAPGKKYAVAANIGNGSAEIFIDGKSVGKVDCGFAPAPGPMLFDQSSNVMRGPASYAVKEDVVHVTTGGSTVDLQSGNSGLPIQLRMLNPAAAGGAEQAVTTGDSIKIETTIQFVAKENLKELSPFIDAYGQSIQANWPGKITSDADLKTAEQTEADRLKQWGTPGNIDQYGGITNAPWKEKATGFFHIVKHDDKWWLISPAGNPCFYIGLCDAPSYTWEATPITGREYLFSGLPSHDGPFAAAWLNNAWHIDGDNADYFAFQASNMIRKFGSDWRTKATQSAVRRVKVLGFSGFGKWSDGDLGVCDLPVVWNHGPNLQGIKHPDVFDPAVRKQIVAVLQQQIEPRKNDPWLLGWSVGNEDDEDIKADEIRQILAMNDEVPAKKTLLAYAGNAKPQAADIEKLREYYEGTYYHFLYTTVKKIDPNHLYFGNWVTPNWWENENDWKLSSANCDVVGFDWYAETFHKEPAGHLIAALNKPILCGEFSFPESYSGQRGYGSYGVHSTDDADAGKMYTQWMHDAALDPHCVGAFYFQYRDQPITGRGPGNARNTLVVGEDYAFGLVDVTDRIKWNFAEQVRQANLGAVALRWGEGK